MFNTLKQIIQENWEWRGQIFNLAIFDLKKQARGAVLGWFWIIAKPLVYIFVFWFALAIGLRVGRNLGDFPYFIWLISGLIPWFFMQDMIHTGSNVFHRYPYLVNKIKFPISGIPTIYSLASLAVNLVLFCFLIAAYFLDGMQPTIYLLQIPFLIILMFFFFNTASILYSLVSGLSNDFARFIKILAQPLFWMSGVIFSIDIIKTTAFAWIYDIMLFNPITFFCTSFRYATCEQMWVWENPVMLGCFLIVFLITVVVMTLAYKKLSREVADVL